MDRTTRNFIAFFFFLGLTILARNQEARPMQSAREGLFAVKAVYVDNRGVKWFATNRGLCRFDNLTWTWYSGTSHLPDSMVTSLAFEASGEGDLLWTGTGKGVSAVAFDETGVTGSRIYSTGDGLLDTMVSAIAVDSRGNLFFGSASGITLLSDGIFSTLTYADYYSNMFSTPVRQLEIYGDTLYIAQNGGIGRLVSGVDGITGASRWESSYGMSPYSGDIKSTLVKGSAVQYFGTDLGVEVHTGYEAKENWSLWNTDSGLVDNQVITIAEDSGGGLWFGTYGGVSHLAGGVWTSYTSAEGLLNDTVYDIGFDADGSVWFATGAGACRLKDGAFRDFLTSLPDPVRQAYKFEATYDRMLSAIRIRYRLQTGGAVTVRLYNVSGILMEQWKDLPGQAGTQTAELSLEGGTSAVTGGIYIILLDCNGLHASRKIVIVR